jgi:hypothetical protein
LYGLRNWVEESYKRMKDELGWADFMVRSDRAIRRHWTLVCCAFAFCWWYEAYRARMIDEATQMACEPVIRRIYAALCSSWRLTRSPAYIKPGSSWQNGFAESFNGKLEDECLNREWFTSRRKQRS